MVAADGYWHVNPALGEHLRGHVLHLQLVGGVAVGEQEVHADGLDASVQELLHRAAGRLLVDGDGGVAEDVYPFGDPPDQVPGHQGLVVLVGADVESVGVGVPEVALDAALQAEVILGTLGHDHPHLAALPLEQAVEHGGARVDTRNQRGERLVYGRVPVCQGVARRVEEPLGLVLGGGLRLADDERTFLVDDERVGHGPACVNREDSWGVHG